jgi:hypothetical protein
VNVIQTVPPTELFALVDERRDAIRAFLEWARAHETNGQSMYLANRPDIADARRAGSLYPEAWWGIVVFTCFGSLNSTRAVRSVFSGPVDAEAADDLLAAIQFSRPMVGHHRIQQGLVGAKKALVAACSHSELLYDVLHTPGTRPRHGSLYT